MSVVGYLQAIAYCRATGRTLELRYTRTAFRFGDTVLNSRGTVHVRIPTPNNGFLALDIHVVDANIPMIMGLEMLDRELLVANNVRNLLICEGAGGWSIPITRKFGHLYICCNPAEILFTRPELYKLHHQFYHPGAGILYNFVKRLHLKN